MESLFEKIKKNSVVLLLLLIGAVFFFLRWISPLISPILLAMLFVTIFGPLLKKIQQKLHIHRQIGAVLLLILAVGILAGLLWLLGTWLINSLPVWYKNLQDLLECLPDWAKGWYQRFAQNNWAWPDDGSAVTDLFVKGGEAFVHLAFEYSGKLALFGGCLVTFLIATILLAKDYDEIMNKLLNRPDCRVLLEVICGVIRYIATFVKAQGVIMSLIACLCGIVLWVSGVEQGVFFGILAGVLDALPFIGTGVVLVPLAIFQVLQGRYAVAVICGILYVACILLREFLEPKFIGKKMGVKPIFILISLYVGIRLFGIAGIIKGPLGFVMIRETWEHLRLEDKKTKNE